MGVTTADFPGGDWIIACLHSNFILVYISLHFPLKRIYFYRTPSSFGGGQNHSLSWRGSRQFLASATTCVVFWVNFDYLPSHDTRSRVDRFACTEKHSFTCWCSNSPWGLHMIAHTWCCSSSNSHWEPHDRLRPFVFQFPARTTHGCSWPLMFHNVMIQWHKICS